MRTTGPMTLKRCLYKWNERAQIVTKKNRARDHQSRSVNMIVSFECPEGHKLKADSMMIGRIVSCPACKSRITVPASEPASVTDTGVVRILEASGDDARVENRSHNQKICPRCGESAPASSNVCGSCRRYFYPTTGAWNAMLKQTLSQIRRQRPTPASEPPARSG